jgi:hypothetical protein
MKYTVFLTIITFAIIFAGTTASFAQYSSARQGGSGVFINGEELDTYTVQQLQQAAGFVIPRKRYWYDAYCGAWGFEGGPTLGVGVAGLPLGGQLKANASNGHSGTFINGRELPSQDVAVINSIISPYRVIPGRFLMDASGNVAYENGMYIGNLMQAYQAKHPTSSGRSRFGGYDSGIGAVNAGGYISRDHYATH